MVVGVLDRLSHGFGENLWEDSMAGAETGVGSLPVGGPNEVQGAVKQEVLLRSVTDADGVKGARTLVGLSLL